MLFQPTNITPDEINGTGCANLLSGLTVQWQVNGTSPLYAYMVRIFSNNASSTLMYSTGKITLDTPWWGKDASGNAQFYSVHISENDIAEAGITNGNEYKLLITQWWSSASTDNIVQSTASVFIGRGLPTASVNNYASTITTKSFTFNGTYAQAQNDALKWIRWQIAIQDCKGNPFLDTGKITGTGLLSCTYDGFVPDGNYSVKLTVETVNGIQATSGWLDFSCTYSVPTSTGTATAEWSCADRCIEVNWSRISLSTGYTVYRRHTTEEIMYKIADMPSSSKGIRDYSVRSNETYVYYIFPIGSGTFLSGAMVTGQVKALSYEWDILETVKRSNGTYFLKSIYAFKNSISEGSFSNNNSPSKQQNFTRYPTRQPSSANYLTGSITGLIGSITLSDGEYCYSDTSDEADAIFDLSCTENKLFLRDPKGRFLAISTDSAISLTVTTKSKLLQQEMTLKWVETADASMDFVVGNVSGSYLPDDQIIGTTVDIDTATGEFNWNRESSYANGSVLTLVDEELIQTTSAGEYIPATLSIDSTTGQLVATV